MINESFEGIETPNKKRKRDNLLRFVSSTPIKIANKENFLFTDSMEHKSIADIVAERNASRLQAKANEFEVIRKPPKKKKKGSEECCFVNPCLDLQVDENPINPFEVVRSDNTEAIMLAKGVANPALDAAAVADPVSVPLKVSTNPFEVIRETEPPVVAKGIDNSAMEFNIPVHKPLMLPLNFTPTVNHRIDFSNMPENLTCALLSTKLVLESNTVEVIGTPKKSMTTVTRKSLSVISELSEDVEIDIGEELDNYQLQLENSINEAKMQNRKYVFDAPKAIAEEPDEEDKATEQENQRDDETVVNNATYTKEVLKTIEESTKEVECSASILSGLKESNVDDERFIDDHNEDVQFEEVDSFDEDFGKLGQFKRAYRTDPPAAFKRPSIKTSTETHTKKSNLGGSIRRSIRKLISHKSEKSTESSENEKHEGLFQSIRHSLRRKPKPKPEPVNLETTITGRSVFREPSIGGSKATLERPTLKRHVVKTMKTFMESVEEFDHY